MRKRSNSFLLLLLPLLFSACNNMENKQEHLEGYQLHETYTCPMHPEVESHDTGQCPKCKMNLELKTSEANEQIVSPNKQVLSRQSTVKLRSNNETQTLKVPGYIDIDRTRNQSLSARSDGRIEKLFVKYDLQFVKKGDKILELYSPELNTFQEEHLFLLKSEAAQTLLEQSRQKLKLSGITDKHISLLEKNGVFTKTITFYSPADGYVFFGPEVKNSTSQDLSQQAPMNVMNMTTQSNTGKSIVSSGTQIREGMYANKGETLFSINDLQNVWANVSVPSDHYYAVKMNTSIRVVSELFPDRPIDGKIALTEQTFEENSQRFIRLRIDLSNRSGELKLNSLIIAEITLEINEQFKIPSSAVYRTGMNSFVWVKTGTTKGGTGIFQLRKVATGAKINGLVTIISGLSTNEEVAEQAGYLTDSETFLYNN